MGIAKRGAVTIYGIKNCDTMKKARTWLDSHGVEYAFHDYKVSGIDRATLEQWQLAGDTLHVADPTSRQSVAVAAEAVGALLGRSIRGEHVSAIAPEASGKYRLVKA